MLDLGQTYLAEDAKQSDPQDEQDGIPSGDEYTTGFYDEGDKVEGTRSRCQSADDDGIDLCVSQTSVSQSDSAPWFYFQQRVLVMVGGLFDEYTYTRMQHRVHQYYSVSLSVTLTHLDLV